MSVCVCVCAYACMCVRVFEDTGRWGNGRGGRKEFEKAKLVRCGRESETTETRIMEGGMDFWEEIAVTICSLMYPVGESSGGQESKDIIGTNQTHFN